MAKITTQKTKAANGPPADPAPESIEQVRDLLFGGQMRMVDARIQSLDQRLIHETSAIRAEFERQIGDLDGSIKKELARHSERLATERTKRVEDLKALNAELRESLKMLERRHQSLEEAAGLADAELRDHLVKQSTAFSSELARTSERISGELERITSALQNEKLDSAALVSGLTDLAAKLTGTPQPTGKRSVRS
jgi:DNA repair exonuclease SbcCD ATPase subunit